MIRPDVELAPNITTADGSYPQGSSKNETAPGNNDGTPHNKLRADDIFGFQQASVKMAAITPSGSPDSALNKTSSQQLQAILHAILMAHTFLDSGAADAYVLDVVGNNPAPDGYQDNMTYHFFPSNSNTGASTGNVEGLGAKNIFFGGVALSGGEIIANERSTIIYDLANDRFNLELKEGKVLQSPATLSGAYLNFAGSTIIPYDNTTPQNTEGHEVITVTITPKKATSILKIRGIIFGASNAGNSLIAALFKDADVNALASAAIFHGGNNVVDAIPFAYEMVAGVTTAITFKIRLGSNVTGSLSFNGDSGGGIFNATLGSFIEVIEEAV